MWMRNFLSWLKDWLISPKKAIVSHPLLAALITILLILSSPLHKYRITSYFYEFLIILSVLIIIGLASAFNGSCQYLEGRVGGIGESVRTLRATISEIIIFITVAVFVHSLWIQSLIEDPSTRIFFNLFAGIFGLISAVTFKTWKKHHGEW